MRLLQNEPRRRLLVIGYSFSHFMVHYQIYQRLLPEKEAYNTDRADIHCFLGMVHGLLSSCIEVHNSVHIHLQKRGNSKILSNYWRFRYLARSSHIGFWALHRHLFNFWNSNHSALAELQCLEFISGFVQ
ncbi:uncharacterized protein A4U43_C09F5750 [Asparagus officinalis]|uniref:Uncharacterized protein n=1 Tax=Asparagus officinalis TaxID=4686 RepID=A0A5P1E5L6_ASPOF|nr:uncharacterized protein A4U43_C09F5750 [Asparagus officinalis]